MSVLSRFTHHRATAPATMSESKVTTLNNYIGGKFAPPKQGKYLDNVEPAVNEVFAQIPRSSKEDVVDAVAAAKVGAKEWGRTAYTTRADILDKIADGIEARKEELARLESRDTGKPFQLALAVDIPRAIANFRFFAGALRHDETQATHMVDALNYTYRSPIGIVGLITPWNLPLYLLSWKVAPAMAMGNAVIAKPSEITPMTANALAEIINATDGVPQGAFNVVHGLGAEAGAEIVAHPAIRCISFTGGTATGRRVAQTAMETFKKLSLELGGKNASVVFADCDFDKTVEGVYRASFANQGQVCLCGSRIFVEKSIAKKFVAALVEKAKNVDIGDPATSSFGCLSSAAHLEKIKFYAKLAVDEGGTIECGGKAPELDGKFAKGCFFLPTIVTGLSPSSRTATEEIFGPIVTVHEFEDEDSMIEQVNSVQYGLAGSVWTESLKRGHRVAQAIESGMVWVNCWLHRDLRVPFGGVKDSGIGREGGRHSLEFYSEDKNICIKLT